MSSPQRRPVRSDSLQSCTYVHMITGGCRRMCRSSVVSSSGPPMRLRCGAVRRGRPDRVSSTTLEHEPPAEILEIGNIADAPPARFFGFIHWCWCRQRLTSNVGMKRELFAPDPRVLDIHQEHHHLLPACEPSSPSPGACAKYMRLGMRRRSREHASSVPIWLSSLCSRLGDRVPFPCMNRCWRCGS